MTLHLRDRTDSYRLPVHGIKLLTPRKRIVVLKSSNKFVPYKFFEELIIPYLKVPTLLFYAFELRFLLNKIIEVRVSSMIQIFCMRKYSSLCFP